MLYRTLLVLFAGCAITFAQGAPKVVSMQPAHLAEVDFKKTKQLVIEFDRAMNDRGWSFCGGGPQFPKLLGRPRWKNTKTLVVDVEMKHGADSIRT